MGRLAPIAGSIPSTTYLCSLVYMKFKIKRLRYIYIIYWLLLTYIIAALVWWFIALNSQNNQMARSEINALKTAGQGFQEKLEKITATRNRKTTQYIGEGATFFLLIMAGAAFVFRVISKQLKQSQQQQNLMTAITHELKTPIAVTKINLETLQKRTLNREQQVKLIQNTLQEANRLNALCNNLLLSSQIEADGYLTTFEETDFSKLVYECVGDFISRYPSRIIDCEMDKDIFVNGDRLLLQMAVNNLIDNALKYSPKDRPVTVRLKESKENALLKISDEGKGIAAEEKEKIFKKYYRIGNASTRAAKGTGLGLYLTKKIVQQHHGKIFISDNKPNGSIFAIQLRADKNR
jgi:two-component system, OmpR family, sensor histidine kinase CiaH